jgi:hypothetical protein
MLSGHPMRLVDALLCYESLPYLVSSHGPSLVIASCYLLDTSHGLIFLLLSVASSQLDVFPEENLSLYPNNAVFDL